MNVLLIGGGGFIGCWATRQLDAAGHRIAILSRSPHPDLPADHIAGNRRDLPAARDRIRTFAPDVVIDFILSSGDDARQLAEVLRGIAGRLVALSSMDVYRSSAVLHRLDSGPLEPVPLTEESALRTTRQTYSAAALRSVQGLMPWVDEAYDKIAVEQAVTSVPDLPATVLRLPMIYGPGDRLRRLHPLLKRMDDRRPAILFAEDQAAWRSCRGYVENVAAAVALAASDARAAGRTYNVAESDSYSELDWARRVAARTGWNGEFIVLPRERMPGHLLLPHNFAQHWSASSRRIREELGYREPVPPDEALDRTIAWERANAPLAVSAAQFDYAAEDAALAQLRAAG